MTMRKQKVTKSTPKSSRIETMESLNKISIITTSLNQVVEKRKTETNYSKESLVLNSKTSLHPLIRVQHQLFS